MEQIGRFQVKRQLGSGGFGAVFLAVDPAIDRLVAIKIFRPKDENVIAMATSTDDEALAILRGRFVSEAKVLASLDNARYVIGVLEYGELDDGSPFYVMPYLPRSLADEIGRDVIDAMAIAELPEQQRPRALPLNRALNIIGQLFEGLTAAHDRGLIHRDIKPANIMLTVDDEVRLVDFGIAKVPDSQYSTVSHLGMGSRNYMAPEQYESVKHVDARADLYAAGIVAYRIIVGKLPIGRFVDPIVAVPELGAPLNELILSLIATERENRPGDGAAALAMFNKARDESGLTSSGDATVVWSRGADDSKLKPLRARIAQVIHTHGVIWPEQQEGLQVLAGIAGVDEPGLERLIAEIIDSDEELKGKAELAARVAQQVAEAGGTLSVEARKNLATAAGACGWSDADLDRLGKMAFLQQGGAPAAISVALPPPSQGRSLLRQRFRAHVAGAVSIFLMLGLSFGIYLWQLDDEQEQSVQGDTNAEETAWHFAMEQDSIDGYRQFLEQWPAGSNAEQAAMHLAQLEERDQPLSSDESENQTELVFRIQGYLNRLGYMVTETGKVDAPTIRSIVAFQEAQHVSATGRVSDGLYEALAAEFDQRDQAAWQQARSIDTPNSYEDYRRAFPQGRFVAEIDARIDALQDRANVLEEQRRAAAAEDERRRREAAELAAAVRAEEQAQRELVRAIQAELKRLGRNIEVDGRIGENTAAEITSFERSMNRAETGSPSRSVLEALQSAQRWPGLKIGDHFRDCPQCPEMRVVQGGRFQMGSSLAERGRLDHEGPQRPVTLPAFAIALSHITIAEFSEFVDDTGYRTDAERNEGGNPGCFAYRGGSDFGWEPGTSWRNPGFSQADDHPVVCVSWNDSLAYINWLHERTQQDYRLLSEAEFEYALRARSTTPWPWGHDDRAACTYGNVADRTAGSQFREWTVVDCDDGYVFTAPVRSFQPNDFGLYDLSGNAWHWIKDCWNDGYLGAPINGTAWMSGDCDRAVLRGGSWSYDGLFLRSAHRSGGSRDYRSSNAGFRVARHIDV